MPFARLNASLDSTQCATKRRKPSPLRLVILVLLATLAVDSLAQAEQITAHVSFERGSVNRVLIEQQGYNLAVYGPPDEQTCERVLVTHGRRDVAWVAQLAARQGTKITAPRRELYWLEKTTEFWSSFTQQRFHDYAQQSTKILAQPLAIDQYVSQGDTLAWRGLEFQVLETPGYTRGSATYISQLDGQRIAFTGDLIHGDGQILDLYSFQDAIPEAQVQGYHGYGARLAALVDSLRKVQAERPDLILPARGPVIRNPSQSIDRLIQRVQSLYANYLSTNALHWYFKEERMRICGQKVLGADAKIELMPYSHHEETPNWVFAHSTSRLLISDSGHAFLLDCGYQRVIDAVKDLIAKKLINQVDGIFVTHFHDDHTDMVQAAAVEFNCPVYATEPYADVLAQPDAYHLPAMTANEIKDIKVMASGQTMQWQEFELTFHFYPGQTYYHGALLARKKGQVPIFFIGDSFAPSGLDDYCVLNRNLVHEDDGYLLCLKKLRDFQEEFWLVNEHIPHVFRFSSDELNYLESRFRQRIEIMRQLFPWDDPNYGIDEQWAVFYPYGLSVQPRQQFDLQVKIINHSPHARRFVVRPHVPADARLLSASEAVVTLASRQTGQVPVTIEAPSAAGNVIVTADVESEGMEFGHWIEALLTVQ